MLRGPARRTHDPRSMHSSSASSLPGGLRTSSEARARDEASIVVVECERILPLYASACARIAAAAGPMGVGREGFADDATRAWCRA